MCTAVKETYFALQVFFGHFRQGISTLSATDPESVRVRARIHEKPLFQHTTYILSVVAGKRAIYARVTS